MYNIAHTLITEARFGLLAISHTETVKRKRKKLIKCIYSRKSLQGLMI
jgi:hypothetical protein